MRSLAHSIGWKSALWILLALAVSPAFANHGNPHPSYDNLYDIKPKQLKWTHQNFPSDLKDTPEEACAMLNGVGSQWGHWENSVPAYAEGRGCRADFHDHGNGSVSNQWLTQLINAQIVCPANYQALDDGNGPKADPYRLNNPFGTMECFRRLNLFVTTAPDNKPEDMGGSCPNSGNPINPVNGNKYQIETDFTDNHAGDLTFHRSYNSLSRNSHHWTHRFDRPLTPNLPQKLSSTAQAPLVKSTPGISLWSACANWVSIRSHAETTARKLSTANYDYTKGECVLTYNGQRIGTLELHAEEESSRMLPYEESIHVPGKHGKAITVRKTGGTWQTVSDMPGNLTQDATGYTWKAEDDSIERYNLNGKLQTITYPSGVAHTLSYNTNGELISVEDSFGRELTFEYASGRMSAMIDPAGHRYEYEYNSNGKMSKVTYPDNTPGTATDNPTRLYHYEDTRFPHALTGITDENANRYATWTYDAYGKAISSEHAGGADEVDLTYNLDGTVTETNALGKQTKYHYGTTINDRRKITRVEGVPGQSCAGASQYTTYDSNGYVDTKTDWNGNVTDYTYNSAGLETQRIEAKNTAQQRTISTTWHSTLRKPTLIAEPGRTTAFTYDSSGNMLTKTVTDTATSAARTTTWTYNSYGQILTVNGPRTDVADVTEYEYDTVGNLIRITDALDHEIEFTSHDGNGNPLTMVDANGVSTTFTYDARQRLLTRTVAHGTSAAATTSFEYWPTGKLKKITQPDGAYLLYTYDNAQRLTQIEDNLGNYIEYTLDDAGNRTAEKVYDPADVLVKTQTAVFDGLSRMIDSLGASSQSTDYTYDHNGNTLTITDPNTRVTTNTFDALSRLIKTVDPQNGSSNPTEYTYDARDNLASVEDPRGLVTQYQYNGFDEVTQLTSPDTGVTSYTYDAAGNKTSQTDAKSVTLNYSHDALNRLTLANASGTADDISYVYDSCTNGVGRLCSVTRGNVVLNYSYDVYGNIANVEQEIGSLSVGMDYVYNEDLHLESVTYPSGVEIRYAYDSAGRLSSITLDEGLTSTTLIDTISYQPFGPIKGYAQDNGIDVTFDFDLDGRIEILDAEIALDREYDYDPAGNIELIDDAITNALDRNFSYDAINRLSLEENLTGTTTLFDYAYDSVGNRTLYDDTVTSQSLTYSGTSNRLTAIANQFVTTDNNGNITSIHGMTLAYDSHNRLSSAIVSSTTTNYAYNGIGERVTKQTGSNIRHYFYNGPQLLAEYDATGNVEREYIYLEDQPVVMLDHAGSGTDIYWIHNDHLGRPLALTDEAGAVVWKLTNADAFGNAASINEDPDNNSTSLTFNLRFPGQYFDAETGLSYNGFRYFDPQIGGYTQADPVGVVPGVASTSGSGLPSAVMRRLRSIPLQLRLMGGLNRSYSYVDANPLRGVDPLGLTTMVFDPASGNLTVDPEVPGRSPYTVPASSGRPNCDCDSSTKDKGPIPSGMYDINSNEVSDPPWYKDIMRNMSGDWGDWRAYLQPRAGTNTYGRSGFFMHGGARKGSAGCIDVGGGRFGNSVTDQILNDIMNDPDGSVPVTVK